MGCHSGNQHPDLVQRLDCDAIHGEGPQVVDGQGRLLSSHLVQIRKGVGVGDFLLCGETLVEFWSQGPKVLLLDTVLIVLIYVKSYLFLDRYLIYNVFVYLTESRISEQTITY